MMTPAEKVLRRLRPVCREQMAGMRDEPMVWSRTHDWPGIRDELVMAGLICPIPELSSAETWTEITLLGREMRDLICGNCATQLSPSSSQCPKCGKWRLRAEPSQHVSGF